MRSLVLIAAAALLGGCNMVLTETPLFTKADAAGAPALKSGVWSTPAAASCDYDPAAPLERWPNCANGGVVKDGAVGGYQADAGGKSRLVLLDTVLAAGEPRVMQLRLTGAPAGAGVSLSGYVYAGVRIAGADDGGRITAIQAWPVLCGPPPADNGPSNGKTMFGSRHPLPGLAMDKDGLNCATASPAAVRAAAAASEKWAGDISTSHWLRPGEH